MNSDPSLSALLAKLPATLQHSFRKRLRGAERITDKQRREQVLIKIQLECEQAYQRLQSKRAALPKISYPEELPVSARREDIAKLIRDHQVVVVAGETGSGKTTQLPKICLELGRGVNGLIGHTQPRRIAARSVAGRIAEELNSQLGETVGYKVRFSDQVSERSFIKLMTDGILLAELQQDRMLSQYDTLIIDEAHERSLNIDFILGYLKQLLPKRPDLKVIITSATIDPERFSRHFENAPIIEVSGRTYPVEIRYHPPTEEEKEKDQLQAIFDAVDELCSEGRGDILVFLNGEREIRDTAEALNRRQLRDTEILPLFARLSAAEQQRVFQSHRGRRIVLATNVAETSLTVPGIKYVIDTGTARISRYSYRTKVQRLPIEPISQASANQRSGRCGRVEAGICIRLYSEEDFRSRPEFTDPEILRTNLASVILQMLALKLGDIHAFPFVEPPDSRNINDGVRLLEEIGAVDPQKGKQLTRIGRMVSRLPVDPRLGRMVVEAASSGCLNEIMVIVAALSIQDPRERPLEKQQASDEKHRRFFDKDSDFVTFLNLWRYLQEQQRELTGNQFRRLCKKEFLAYMRVREWQDVHAQLRQSARELEFKLNQNEADYDTIHQALLSGLLSHVGFRDQEHSYQGARNSRFYLFPGSTLSKSKPKWVIAAELVETSKLFARVSARIQPQWIEPMAQHLVKRSYSEPHWAKKPGNVQAHEKQTLYGLTIVDKRNVSYGRIKPDEANQIFVRTALVERELGSRVPFYRHNNRLIDEIHSLEDKARRRDILIDEERLMSLYRETVPSDIYNRSGLESWYRKASKQQPELLKFSREQLMARDPNELTAGAYPDNWRCGNLDLSLAYQFEPGAQSDGVRAQIPVAVLNQVDDAVFEWGIPAHREALLVALIKSLPKPLRRNFVPAPNYAKKVLAAVDVNTERLLPAISKQLLRMTGVRIPEDAWDLTQIPEHLRFHFQVLDDNGRAIGVGDDLQQLRQQLQHKVSESLSQAAESDIEREGLSDWDFPALPEKYVEKKRGYEVKAYPALQDQGASVAVKLFDHQATAQQAHKRGLRRLILLNVPSPIKFLQESLPNKAKLAMYYNRFGTVKDLVSDCIAAAVDQILAGQHNAIRDPDAFQQAKEQVRAELADTALKIAQAVEGVLVRANGISKVLKKPASFDTVRAQADIKAQLDGLIYKGFLADTGADRLADLHRYLDAAQRRLEKLSIDPNRDRLKQVSLDKVSGALQELKAQFSGQPDLEQKLAPIRWMIEELRVSYFAETLGTPYPISEKRVLNAISEAKQAG